MENRDSYIPSGAHEHWSFAHVTTLGIINAPRRQTRTHKKPFRDFLISNQPKMQMIKWVKHKLLRHDAPHVLSFARFEQPKVQPTQHDAHSSSPIAVKLSLVFNHIVSQLFNTQQQPIQSNGPAKCTPAHILTMCRHTSYQRIMLTEWAKKTIYNCSMPRKKFHKFQLFISYTTLMQRRTLPPTCFCSARNSIWFLTHLIQRTRIRWPNALDRVPIINELSSPAWPFATITVSIYSLHSVSLIFYRWSAHSFHKTTKNCEEKKNRRNILHFAHRNIKPNRISDSDCIYYII